MTDGRPPLSSEEMIRRAREELGRLPDPATPMRGEDDPPRDLAVQPPPIRPRRIVSRSGSPRVVAPRRLLVAIAISGLLVVAGAVIAFITAAAP